MNVPVLTFGFMDERRAAAEHAKVFAATRQLAAESFLGEKICDLSSYVQAPLEALHDFFSGSFGAVAGRLRHDFYHSAPKPIQLPDMQAYFCYAFTVGVNFVAHPLAGLTLEEAMEPMAAQQILDGSFPIRGPEWLCNAANSEIPHVEDVACEFQDRLIVPAFREKPEDGRYGADLVGAAMLWFLVAGMTWTREAFTQLVTSWEHSKAADRGEVLRCQVKRIGATIGVEEIGEVKARLDELRTS